VAYVNIIKGCDKFCSYCIVPFTRGREKSRGLKEVVEDVRRLVEFQGIQEIMLLGQNVNSFGKDQGTSFADLLLALDEIQGLKLIRYTTSHPYDVTDELIAVHAKAEKLAPHLHLPIQSGSNSVLKRMLRQYSVEHYLSLLHKLRLAKPNIVVTSDIIAGFPNETEREHEDTLRMLDQAQFDSIFSYTFSVRRGTKAARMSDVLTESIRSARLQQIQKKQLSIQQKIRSEMVGKTFRLLVDGQNDMKGVHKWKGRTTCNRLVHFSHPEGDLSQTNYLWKWVDVKIDATSALSCQGIFVRLI
jgi:tRNA-2-methylthio-N6-dimethylallyladenosine synthase